MLQRRGPGTGFDYPQLLPKPMRQARDWERKNISAPRIPPRLTRGFLGGFRPYHIWWVEFLLTLTACAGLRGMSILWASHLRWLPYLADLTEAQPSVFTIRRQGEMSPKWRFSGGGAGA